MRKENGVLYNVEQADIEMMQTNPNSFWEGVKKIGNRAFSGCENLTEIEIPESVKEIGQFAFISCEKLKHVTLHDGIKRIGYGAFDLKNVEIHSDFMNRFEETYYLRDISTDKDLYKSENDEELEEEQSR